MKEKHKLTDRDMAIEGYGQDYKGVLPDGTVTGLMSYNGSVFKHYVETGDNTWRHPRWERDYNQTPLRTALEIIGKSVAVDGNGMKTDEVVYQGTHYPSKPMENVGLSGWQYDYHDKRSFKRSVLQGEISFPAPAIFSRFGNVYIVEGHAEEVEKKFWDQERQSVSSTAKTQSGTN